MNTATRANRAEGMRRALALLLGISLPAGAAWAQVDERAALLYENHCTGCHTSQVHIREHSKARSIRQVGEWVRYWAMAQGLGWTEEDVAAVVQLLNERHYGY